MDKVRVFLDVDGVLNAVCFRPPKGWRLDGDIVWSPEVGQFFADLALRDNVDLVWLTTWAEHANRTI